MTNDPADFADARLFPFTRFSSILDGPHSTRANESGRYGGDAIERQLAHTPDNKVRAAYNRAAYMAERTRMMQDWADWLGHMEGGAVEPGLAEQVRA